MPRKPNPDRQLRGKLNLTIHPEIRGFAEQLSQKRRRSISQLVEDLVEAEWLRAQNPPQQPQYYAPQPAPQPAYYAPAPVPAPAQYAQPQH